MKELFFAVGFFVFIVTFFVFVLAPTKNQKSILLWSFLKTAFFVALLISWDTENVVLKWILIETSTLIGALLISSSGTERSFYVGWKFLLINSYSLGLAFLGLVILLYASTPLENLDFRMLELGIGGQSGLLLESGILLVIFGYSGKLGLVPNHHWVGDTYAESSSQISSLIASFVPVSIVIAIRPFIELERNLNPHWINSLNGLFLIGILTILYSIFIVQTRDDIRRISAKVALFHTGMLTVFLWVGVEDDVFYFLLTGTILVKLLLFLAMGILRMDAGHRKIADILSSGSISSQAFYAYLFSFFIAFIFPLSPIFVLDLKLIEISVENSLYFILIFPILSSIFFFIALLKILPLKRIANREFHQNFKKQLRIRIIFFWLTISVTVIVGVFGGYTLLGRYL